jgi:hypothetical protein
MNFGELIQQALDYSGSREVRAARQAVNDIRRRLARIGNQTVNATSVTIATSQTSYGLGSDWSITDALNVLGITYQGVGDSYTNDLAEDHPRNVIAMQSGEAEGIPRVYAIQGASTVYLYPLPETGATLTVHYTPLPSDLALESDTPDELNEAFHQLVAMGAASLLAPREDLNRAQYWERRYMEGEREYAAWITGRRSAKVRRLGRGASSRRFRIGADPSRDMGD